MGVSPETTTERKKEGSGCGGEKGRGEVGSTRRVHVWSGTPTRSEVLHTSVVSVVGGRGSWKGTVTNLRVGRVDGVGSFSTREVGRVPRQCGPDFHRFYRCVLRSGTLQLSESIYNN